MERWQVPGHALAGVIREGLFFSARERLPFGTPTTEFLQA